MEDELFIRLLDSKEARRDRQINLIGKYKDTLISFTLNIPGIEKDNSDYRRVHREAFEYILKNLKKRDIEILLEDRIDKSTGSEGYIVVKKDAKFIKYLMIQIEENHMLGRIFDIDVFDKNHTQISRGDLDLKGRKCLICDRDVRLCIREKRHSREELLREIKGLIEEYFNLTKK